MNQKEIERVEASLSNMVYRYAAEIEYNSAEREETFICSCGAKFNCNIDFAHNQLDWHEDNCDFRIVTEAALDLVVEEGKRREVVHVSKMDLPNLCNDRISTVVFSKYERLGRTIPVILEFDEGEYNE